MDDSHFCKIFLNERIAEGKAFDPNDFTVRKQLAACLSNKQQPFMSRSSLIRWMGAS